MDDGHAQLTSWLEVGGDVVHEHDALRGDGQLLGSETVDGRFWLALADAVDADGMTKLGGQAERLTRPLAAFLDLA
jgi:hypothetical protein